MDRSEEAREDDHQNPNYLAATLELIVGSPDRIDGRAVPKNRDRCTGCQGRPSRLSAAKWCTLKIGSRSRNWPVGPLLVAADWSRQRGERQVDGWAPSVEPHRRDG
jgi:hypothetical protein